MKRRDFVIRCGSWAALAVTALALPNAWAAQLCAGADGPPPLPATSVWPTLLNERFRLFDPAAGRMNLTLVDFKELESSSALHQFTLTFRSETSVSLTEGTYPMAHRKTGKFLLHLHPVGESVDGMQYRAHFSLLA